MTGIRAAAVALAVVITLAATDGDARGEDFFPAEAPPSGTERVSYGKQIFAADVAGLALVVGAVGLYRYGDTPSQISLGGAALLWGFGGPVIHVLHGQKKRAVTSLALRWGLSFGLSATFALASAGTSASCGDDGDDGLECLAETVVAGGLGFVIGGAIAQVIDWTSLARKDVPATRSRTRVSIMPVNGGAGLTLVGNW